MNNRNVAILGIGIDFPEHLRKNDWWPTEVVDLWRDKQKKSIAQIDKVLENNELCDVENLILSSVKKYGDDPFNGAKQRYIVADDEKSSDLETRAAQDALKKAGIKPEQLDFILIQTTTPDHLSSTNAALVQARLGASNACFVQSTEGMCNAFLSQLQLGQAMIESGQAEYGVIIQASTMSRHLDPTHYMSSQFTDGATAVILGNSESKSLLSLCHFSDGSIGNYANLGIEDKNWYDRGEVQVYMNETNTAQIQQGIELSKELVEKSLQEAGVEKSQINFFSGHQGIAWFREVTQKYAGLEHAKSFDSYPLCTSIVGGNIPLTLLYGMEKGLLKKGDLVSCYTPAVGTIASAAVFKWEF